MSEPSGRRVAVLGNGGFGTALAVIESRRGHAVRLWGHDAEYTARVRATRDNPRYLPGVTLPDSITVGSDARAVLDRAEIVLSVVPTQHLRSVLAQVAASVPRAAAVVSCSKGMEESTGLLPSAVLRDALPENPLFVLTGPCHAEELVQGKPASVVLAGPGGEALAALQADLACPNLRIYRSADALGAELGGALKNVIAIAAGIGDGLGLGDNAKSALLTRGLFEIARFGVALGAQRETFFGLAGLGDLITTAISPHGRNRALGERIGRGETLADVLATTRKVAEGVWTCRAVLARARSLGVAMPISEEVAAMLFADKPPAAAVRDLMARLLKEEA